MNQEALPACGALRGALQAQGTPSQGAHLQNAHFVGAHLQGEGAGLRGAQQG